MSTKYIPAPGRKVPLPGGLFWPEAGRAINPASTYEQRLVKDGDLVKKPAATKSVTPKPPKED